VEHLSSCSELKEKLEQARILLHHIELDMQGTEQNLRIDPRDYVREHYEWLKRKRVEIEEEVRELKHALRSCRGGVSKPLHLLSSRLSRKGSAIGT